MNFNILKHQIKKQIVAELHFDNLLNSSLKNDNAARYVEDINSWVSDIWTSKLGPNILVTHNEHELEGTTYGHILCYLVSADNTIFECPNINHPFGTALDTCPI